MDLNTQQSDRAAGILLATAGPATHSVPATNSPNAFEATRARRTTPVLPKENHA